MDKLRFGDKIESKTTIKANKVLDVVPIRYDGVQMCFVVTDPVKSTHVMIVLQGEDKQVSHIMLSNECENIYLLADAIVG